MYLLRNEKHFALYAFDDGAAFEPDFLLYLVEKRGRAERRYIAFIEPKGKHLLKADEWKERFLLRLKDEAKIEALFEKQEYVVLGLPFYNEEARVDGFSEAFDEQLVSQWGLRVGRSDKGPACAGPRVI